MAKEVKEIKVVSHNDYNEINKKIAERLEYFNKLDSQKNKQKKDKSENEL